jgi:hypothetical protein
MIINSAVALECFNETEKPVFGMLHDDWDNLCYNAAGNPWDFDGYLKTSTLEQVDDRLLASEWYKLFDTDDARHKLTWRGLFTNWGNTNVYNYYSPQEDVVGDIDHDRESILASRKFAWGAQEKTKGRLHLSRLCGSKEGGWGFNRALSVLADHRYGRSAAPQMTREISDWELTWEPFFRKKPGQLFKPCGASFAEKHWLELLATAIPARTFGVGANPISGHANYRENHNMPAAFVAEKGGKKLWFRTYRPSDGVPWGHGHFLDVAYVYVYKMWDQLVTDGGLNQ